IFVNI
ncbi:hypothetical protein CFOL_v3_28087, partial [Cephalotus follicularis]